jgi:hypothetical protein
MIRKPTIIITSLGRTGTKFFCTLFRELVNDGTSLHEPDVLNISQYYGTRSRLLELVQQVKESGLHNLLLRKTLGQWSLIGLSDGRVKGEIRYPEAVRRVLKQRKNFIERQPGSIYVESSIAYYGLIDVLDHVFDQHSVAYIVRDGREWIRSWMSWSTGAGMYDKSRIRGLVAHTWPTALDIEGDPYARRWRSLTRFGRLCWGWARLNQYALDTVEKNPSARVFRFEDIFEDENRYQNLEDMLRFLTKSPEGQSPRVESLDGCLARRIHKSPDRFPAWPDWSPQHKERFAEICGSLMDALDYQLD